MLAALEASAVDLLVSDDRGLRRKARRLRLEDRVLTIDEALRWLHTSTRQPLLPPPAVTRTVAHSIAMDDPILESFRDDYPDFNEWFDRCRRQHRLTWMVQGHQQRCAAFCIVKEEFESAYHLDGKLLKICSFKVQGEYAGNRFGELLLKAVFEQASAERVHSIYLTVFERHEALTELLEDFGFQRLEARSGLGELVFAKPLAGAADLSALTNPLEQHIRLGPMHLPAETPWYLVPIQPRFSDVLFPESAPVGSLFPGHFLFGNALRKAYLCNSPLRILEPGSVLAFYRSQNRQAIVAVGVVERVIRTQEASEIARAVAKRTVYTFDEILKMCSRPTLAVLFRQAFTPVMPVQLTDLRAGGVIRSAPQSIMQLRGEARSWLEKKLRG